jgi:F-type H+-transporting ATPase subunit gamma
VDTRAQNYEVIAIGKKAVTFTKHMGITLAAQFTQMPEVASVNDILAIANLTTNGFLNHDYRQVWLLHMDFINTLTQKVKVTPLLPLSAELEEVEHGMVTPEIHTEYTFEPNPKEILGELLPYYLESSLFQTLLESKASEHSARMVAMKNASDNAKSLVSELKLQYNKSRQASITSELLDITTATLTVTQ